MSLRSEAADIRLAWDRSPDPVTGYTLYWSMAPITSASFPAWQGVGASTYSYVVTLGSGSWWFRYKACNQYGCSNYSNEVCTTVASTSTTTTICGGCGYPPCDNITLRIVP